MKKVKNLYSKLKKALMVAGGSLYMTFASANYVLADTGVGQVDAGLNTIKSLACGIVGMIGVRKITNARSIAAQATSDLIGSLILKALISSFERRLIVSSLCTFATYERSFLYSTIVTTRSSSPRPSILFANFLVFTLKRRI